MADGYWPPALALLLAGCAHHTIKMDFPEDTSGMPAEAACRTHRTVELRYEAELAYVDMKERMVARYRRAR